MKNELINDPKILEIEVVDEQVVSCNGNTPCYPEDYFENLEKCKLCGKII